MNQLLDCCELALKQELPKDLIGLKSQIDLLKGQRKLLRRVLFISTVILIALAAKEIHEHLNQRG